MKVLYSWLKDLVDTNMSIEDTARILTKTGVEAGSIVKRQIPRGVVVARVLSKVKHPNADKLSLCSIDAGGEFPLQVVCGAPNVAEGMTVALATIGTTIGSLTIKKAAIRGVESSGMLCSEHELGISDDHSGILPLSSHYRPGTILAEYLPDEETFEVEITPNRGDCLSMLGLARELSAKLGAPLKGTTKRPSEGPEPVAKFISVEVKAPEACPRYTGRFIRGVTVGPSPEWLARRLTAAGLRPINNVVDVTNYAMLHFGHPMHAFDYQTIAGRKILVRRATAGQRFVTLDEVERTLTGDDLLVCDAEKPVALAGVMGGLKSGISSSTTDVFLECAYFDPVGIRKTSKRLGLSTDSSYRFERGVDYGGGLVDALDTAAQLIAELAGGDVAAGRIDAYPAPIAQHSIRLRPTQVNRVLGVQISREQIVKTLAALGIAQTGQESDSLVFAAPSHRHDLTIEADLIEEVGRMYGYDNIPSTTTATVWLDTQHNSADQRANAIRTALAGVGLNEIATNSMVSPRKHNALAPDRAAVALLNPLTPDMSQMRTSLLGNMLETVAYNLNRRNHGNRFFEIGRTYVAVDGSELPRERDVVAIGLEGAYWPAAWNTPALDNSLFVLKGVLTQLAASAGMGQPQFDVQSPREHAFDEECAVVKMGAGTCGTLGKVRTDTCKSFDIKTVVYYAELDITEFLQNEPSQPRYTSLPRFPAVERDFCFVMASSVPAEEVCSEIRRISPLVEETRPFDLYQGEKLGVGKKSIAYSVRLRSNERTLTDKEADAVSQSIVSTVSQKFGATLRT